MTKTQEAKLEYETMVDAARATYRAVIAAEFIPGTKVTHQVAGHEIEAVVLKGPEEGQTTVQVQNSKSGAARSIEAHRLEIVSVAAAPALAAAPVTA